MNLLSKLENVIDKIAPGPEMNMLIGMQQLINDSEFNQKYSQEQFDRAAEQVVPKVLIVCQLLPCMVDPSTVGKKILEHHMQLVQPDFENIVELEYAWLYTSIENFVNKNRELFF